MKDLQKPQHGRASVGSRIIASLKEAVDWVEGKHVEVRVTTVEVTFPEQSSDGVELSIGVFQKEYLTVAG